MNKNKFNLRNVLAIAICLVVSTAFVGCDNKENLIVGKWITAGNQDNNWVKDGRVIVFTEDFFVRQYFDYLFADEIIIGLHLPPYVTYSISGNEITFTVHRSYPTAQSFDETFRFTLTGNSLTIRGFSNPFSITQEVRTDVHFTRVR